MAKDKIVVEAQEKGFHGGQIRNPGERFAVDKGSKASWFTEADATLEKSKKPDATDDLV